MNQAQATGQEAPSAREVFSQLGETATQLSTYVSRLFDEQPVTVLAGALAAGFILGGGLASRVGARLTASGLRMALGNATTLVALDIVRRAIEDGGFRGSVQGAGAG
jgi:hypothetical protein